jgi:putative membrane-bound dehydrogenase-like protein
MILAPIVALLVLGSDPTTSDPRLVIERFAADPDIVTPTGVAVDAKGGVLVIESHTHFRPDGYQGPPADRIRRFEDPDHDGKADKITTVFEGTKFTMSLAVDGDGSLVVATRYEVFRLRDADGDGKFELKTTLARLDTPGNYPHNGLSGVVIKPGGAGVLFGLGENLGARYKLIGADGATLVGGGEGGNVYSCSNDGSNLKRLATGFWNPFAMALDPYGRLFAVDNDPDSRPPCRLLHIVPQGDYGYRFRNGRKGLHPFTAWNGELPGTLPMVAGTGEAPSGLVVYESDNLPDEYRGNILSTSWGDHRIERFRLAPQGASFRSRAESIVTGGENFRPVGIAQAPDGSLYISDWVDKSYNLHGKGAVWHLRTDNPRARSVHDDPVQALAHADLATRRAAAQTLITKDGEGLKALIVALLKATDPRARGIILETVPAVQPRPTPFDRLLRTCLNDPVADIRAMAIEQLQDSSPELDRLAASDPSPLVRAAAIRRVSARSEALIIKALESDDPFLLAAARQSPALSEKRLVELTSDAIPAHRLQAFLALRERNSSNVLERLPAALADSDPMVRFSALECVAERELKQFRPVIEEQLATGASSRQLFEAYLATLARLDGELHRPDQEVAGEEYVARVLLDPKTAAAVRPRALRALRSDHPALTLSRLKTWLGDSNAALELEAVRTLRESSLPQRFDLLASVADDARRPTLLRAEAIVGMRADRSESRDQLLTLAGSFEPVIQHEAVRSLRGAELSSAQLEQLRKNVRDPESLTLLAMLSKKAEVERRPDPSDRRAWVQLLEGPADVDAGARVFFHPSGPGCYRCHSVEGRGGNAGPDLSTTGRVLDRGRLLESILEPSKEVAPQFVAWSIAKNDGTVATGLLVEETPEGDQVFVDSQGKPFRIKSSDIAERRPQTSSIMPADLHRSMTLGELRDLFAFLQAPRGTQ